MHRVFCLLFVILCVGAADASKGRWHVGVEFGELPIQGSFKPGISVGYYFNDLLYTGFVYQIRDRIARNDHSLNAKAIALAGMVGSTERVGQRAYLQMRFRPHRLAPFVSAGLVFNDWDTETIQFDARRRMVAGKQVDGPLTVIQKRPSGIRPALGLGYGYTFDSGLEVFAEWSGWWLAKAPAPVVDILGDQIDLGVTNHLQAQITESFQSRIFNTYHIFQIGVGYTW